MPYGAMWANYGNPGSRYGTNYTYALVVANLKENQLMRLCDVGQQVLRSFGTDGRENGYAQFAYVQIKNSAETIYGWVMVAYEKYGQGVRYTYHW